MVGWNAIRPGLARDTVDSQPLAELLLLTLASVAPPVQLSQTSEPRSVGLFLKLGGAWIPLCVERSIGGEILVVLSGLGVLIENARRLQRRTVLLRPASYEGRLVHPLGCPQITS